jgi:hypothetical protein
VQALRLDIAEAFKSYRAEKEKKQIGIAPKSTATTTAAKAAVTTATAASSKAKSSSTTAPPKTPVRKEQQKNVVDDDDEEDHDEGRNVPVKPTTSESGSEEKIAREPLTAEEIKMKIDNNTAALYNTRIRKKINRGDLDKAMQFVCFIIVVQLNGAF